MKQPCYHLLGCREDIHHSSEAALEQVSLAPETKIVVPRLYGICHPVWSFSLQEWSPAHLDVSLPHIPPSGDRAERPEGQMQWRSESSASGCREDKGRSTLDLTSELDLLWAGDWTRWSPHALSSLGCSCPCVFILKIPRKTNAISIPPYPQKPQPTL